VCYTVAIMYVERIKCKRASKTYEQVLVRESYRETSGGRSRVKHRTLMNLTRCPRQLQDAVAVALREPGHVLEALGACSRGEVEIHEGRSVGAVWCVAKVAERLGITKALGRGRQAQLALWQVIARVIEQGSRLSAVRLHDTHAMADVIGLERGFDEEDLYGNLAWLSERQGAIEMRLFKARDDSSAPTLFLYDVTSSYLEGEHNALGAYGYNRDGKRGKKQIVIGLLCDEGGKPLSVEVFKGNTQDPATVAPQIRKSAKRFGCARVTFVGDRGMVKSAQIEPQIETLLKGGIVQMELFDKTVCEVEHEGVRYILRRNPMRAAEMAATRADKQATVERLVAERNRYLAEHRRAKVATAERLVREKISRLKVDRWLSVKVQRRRLSLDLDEHAMAEAARLDGCYVIKTDLPKTAAGTHTIHDRYKDLTHVEQAFRTCKSGHLQLRPIYVRSEPSTRGHVFVVMLAYLIRCELQRAWAELDLTVEEGLNSLKTLCTMSITIGHSAQLYRIPTPRKLSGELLARLDIQIPPVLPHRELHVATKRKLHKRRANC